MQVFGRGKTRRRPMPSLCESGENEEAEWEEAAGDYVFRIVNNAITDREGLSITPSIKCSKFAIYLQYLHGWVYIHQLISMCNSRLASKAVGFESTLQYLGSLGWI